MNKLVKEKNQTSCATKAKGCKLFVYLKKKDITLRKSKTCRKTKKIVLKD